VANLPGERVRREWLLNEAAAAFHQATADHIFIRVSRHEYNREIGTDLPHSSSELATVNDGHDDIGQNQAKPLARFPDDLQRLWSSGCLDHGVAGLPKRPHRHSHDIGLVLHHQNELARCQARRWLRIDRH
jgi:hypothetical protein